MNIQVPLDLTQRFRVPSARVTAVVEFLDPGGPVDGEYGLGIAVEDTLRQRKQCNAALPSTQRAIVQASGSAEAGGFMVHGGLVAVVMMPVLGILRNDSAGTDDVPGATGSARQLRRRTGTSNLTRRA